MPSCIHRDRELHRDQNHNINYRKTCITAQILATFLLGKLNLNYKMNIVKQDSKFAKKKDVDSCIAGRQMFKIGCCMLSYNSVPPTIISVFGSLQFLSLRDKRFPRVSYYSAVKFGTKPVFFRVIISKQLFRGYYDNFQIKSLEPEHKTSTKHVLFSV